MATKILNPKKIKELQPATLLWNCYTPENAPLRFTSTTEQDAKNWQQKTREELIKTLGIDKLSPVSPEAEIIEKFIKS